MCTYILMHLTTYALIYIFLVLGGNVKVVIKIERRKALIQKLQAKVENPWTVWIGASEAIATQLKNEDDSNPYVCKTSVTTEMLASGVPFDLKAELFKITYVNPDNPPDVNTGWFLSLDDGATKDRVKFLTRSNEVANTYWDIIVQNG